jgi:molybdopterin-dependent oxidoreductase alpha subunit
MAKKAPLDDVGDRDLRVEPPKRVSAGVPGVVAGLAASVAQMGVGRSARTLRRVNQTHGFDCPGCAWPEPDAGHRSLVEFCENGAKAVAEEATLRRVTADFFAQYSITELASRSDHWLGQQGRLGQPVVRRTGRDHYEPIDWDEAFDLMADRLAALASPDQAIFYTSGRTSNEAAFCWQLLAREYGTNNLPDCSNMCHESSGLALSRTIGVGKGSVTLDDVHAAGLLVVVGQNPGTNHPRMLLALDRAKRSGAKLIAINPLPEAGLIAFRNPQTVRGLVGAATTLADRYLQVRVGGDLALFQAIGALLIEWGAVNKSFVDECTEGYDGYAAQLATLDWAKVATATGLSRGEIEAAARMFADSPATVVCWAMGLTQQQESVATIQEIVNVQLLRGMIGRPGAGLCPVRGHSNVQGDRTMGIVERPPAWAPALTDALGVTVPARPGYATVEAIRAMRDGRARVFLALGGNFAAATPDTTVSQAALRSCSLTVHIATKLNRSHVLPGAESLILPCLGRTERDEQAAGEQFVTVEDSMSCVHPSRGRLAPATEHLLSEVAIVTRLGEALGRATWHAAAGGGVGGSGGGGVDGFGGPPWAEFRADYRAIRQVIARVVPGFERFEERVNEPGGFTLPHPPRDARSFPTASGRARFTATALSVIEIPPGRLLLQTVRSHDQYNTTIYGLDDRYRGVHGGRRVVFVHPDDLAELAVPDGSTVDIVSEWRDGLARRAVGFRVVGYPTARGCAATYFPEGNVLVPLDSTAVGSGTPTSKQIMVRLEPTSGDPDEPGSTAARYQTSPDAVAARDAGDPPTGLSRAVRAGPDHPEQAGARPSTR